MKKLLSVTIATPLLLANNSRADDAPLHPQFKLSRQDEDWSVLRDPALRTDAFDTVKFIPMNRDGSSWRARDSTVERVAVRRLRHAARRNKNRGFRRRP